MRNSAYSYLLYQSLAQFLRVLIVATCYPPIVLGGTWEEGNEAVQRKDFDKALVIFKDLSEKGSGQATHSLATMYTNGEGVSQDLIKAGELMTQSAETGYVPAILDLANMYFKGLGVERDYSVAVRRYKQAAIRGVAYAQIMLGDIYFFGYGVEQDYREAEQFYLQAAEQRAPYAKWAAYPKLGIPENYANLERYASADGKFKLGAMYYGGMGRISNPRVGLELIRAAALEGNKAARRFLSELPSQ